MSVPDGMLEKDKDDVVAKLMKTLYRHYFVAEGLPKLPMQQAMNDLQNATLTIQAMMIKDLIKEMFEEEYRRKGR